MPNKAFLKKKSFLDDFRDNQEGTGYIQSARAERTWNNPITRGKRTKKLNTWIKSFDGKRHIHKLARFNRMQHENLEEAMSLTKFTDVVTDKLIKQYDVDEDDVLGYVESHSQELQELLDDKELSLKEKVLFLREEITGVKNEGYGGTKSVMSIWGNRPRDVYPEVSYSSVNDMYNTLLKYGYGDMHPIYYKNNSPEQIKGHILGYFKWTPTNSDADIEADALAAATMIKNNFNKSEAVKPTDEKLSYEKGHKNSDGEDAPWVIRSHEDNRILASFANKKDAEEHMRRMKQYSKTESRADGERDVDDYDTMRDGLEALGFELDSDVRNGKIYSYRRVSKATKDGITYTFMIESDKGYTTSIVVYGGKFDNNERGTRFSNVKEVLDAMKTIEESKKSESLINKNEMEAIAEAEESRILDAVQKAAKEAGVDDKLEVSSDKVLVKATLPIDNRDIGEITWVIDGVNGKLTEYVDGKEGYSKKFTDEDPLKDELRICFAAVKDVAGIPESKKTEAVHFEYTDTIRVPQWLWVAYQTGEAHDLNEDELEILDKFKEEYGSKYHMDDKSEDPYFSSRNDFDNLGGNVYDVDLYVEKPVENKRTEALSTNLEHPFSFKFKFDSPRVTYAMRDEADSGKYDAKLAVTDNDATDVEIFTDSPKAVLKLLDGVAERYNDTYKGMLTRDDLENHFTEAIARVKDVDDDLAAKYFVAFNGKESDGLVVSGELDNVVSFLEAVK